MLRTSFLTLAVLLIATSAMAAPVGFNLTPKDFNAMGVTGAANAMLSTDWNEDGWQGTVRSQTFTLSNGKYLYLYQVSNMGPDSMEVFVIRGFMGAETATAGYLNANLPSGFVAGGVTPLGQSYQASLGNISYQYPSYNGSQLDPGYSTQTLFMVASGASTSGVAFVIDGGNPAGAVYVPVPEPTTMAVLLGGVGMAILRRIRK